MRVREDYLRILRFFRFLAVVWWSGESRCRVLSRLAGNINRVMKTLSVERIWMEMKKLLSAPEIPLRRLPDHADQRDFGNVFCRRPIMSTG